MTTHFSNGVTNVRGKSGGTSLFSSIKQPLITGGYEQEQAYQNDFVQYNVSDWETVTSTGGSDFQLAQFAGGWLRQGDNAPAAGEIQGVAGYDVWNYSDTKKWMFETSMAITTVSDLNTWVGFAVDDYADSDTLPTATAGDVCVYVQSIDTTGGFNALTINAAGTDVWATGSVIESRAGGAVTHDISTAGETALVFTPAAAATNLLTTGGTIAFICYTTGTWNIAYKLGGAADATTGAFAFGA